MQDVVKKIGLLLVVWTILAILFTPQTYILHLRAVEPLTWLESVSSNLGIFYIWAGLTPIVWLLGKSFPIEKSKQTLNFSVLFISGFPVAFIHLIIFQQASQFLLGWIKIYQTPIPINNLLIGMGASNVILYWLIIVAAQADIYFRRYTEREQFLVRAQLQALKTQLHPHFLFNTLNAISQLLYENKDEAEKTISRLGDLLRLSLKSEQTHEVALREEMDFLRMYLEIQQTLLQDRLEVIWRVLPQTLDVLVPNMILQPLVENSIRHGIAPRISGGKIKIIATLEDKWLTLRICDNGLGVNSNNKKTKQFGIGVSNTKKRLKHLYGKEHEFKLISVSEGTGTIAFLKIPFRLRHSDNERINENSDFNSGRYGVSEETHPALSGQGL